MRRLALAAALVLTACGSPTVVSTPTTTETPPPDPLTVCANQLDYWVGQKLAGVTDTYEYQAMGLTGDQYEVFIPLADEAIRQRDAGVLRDGWVREQATEKCRGILAKADPSAPGWP
ncbi:hypothetical protein [Alloactinosynnema sp. L-07]|uniref:hypothetical protein n=1 Tax=Alloactinosynnema sp. L-07 TaxID=1653480 RepID=UPI00065F045E|nr:hypothetical protein [Alloactinosynnema sp. L-07]CRK56132.1 hypothetical protein [Alloactinosynnema sp. L-07]